MIENLETLGSRLKQLRLSKHLKQGQVADLVDVTKSAICTYEKDLRQPSYDILVRLATLYRVSTDYLLGCQNRPMIEVSGLTKREIAMITELVSSMTEKNKLLSTENKG